MSNLKTVIKDLHAQWDAMIVRGIYPVLEFPTSCDNDWLLVEVSIHDKGLLFMFDEDNKSVSFSGEIKKLGDAYLLPFDRCFDHLDHYLQQIHEEITEGYLLPNDLDFCEE
jgi:hypothetical protein